MTSWGKQIPIVCYYMSCLATDTHWNGKPDWDIFPQFLILQILYYVIELMIYYNAVSVVDLI